MFSFQLLSVQIDITWSKKETSTNKIKRILHQNQVDKMMDEMKHKQAQFLRFN